MQPIVATDLPLEAQAFLVALSLGESEDDDGDYNELCGGGYFEDFSAFPEWEGLRGPWGISHAAGRYQFEPATWRRYQMVLKLPDFGPESQDRAAWALAQDDYRRRINQDLMTDLQLGHWIMIEHVLKKTWTSLGVTFQRRYERALVFIRK